MRVLCGREKREEEKEEQVATSLCGSLVSLFLLLADTSSLLHPGCRDTCGNIIAACVEPCRRSYCNNLVLLRVLVYKASSIFFIIVIKTVTLHLMTVRSCKFQGQVMLLTVALL